MLQNRCKGIYFSRNNQKKTHKKSQTCNIFLILGWICKIGAAIVYRLNTCFYAIVDYHLIKLFLFPLQRRTACFILSIKEDVENLSLPFNSVKRNSNPLIISSNTGTSSVKQ